MAEQLRFTAGDVRDPVIAEKLAIEQLRVIAAQAGKDGGLTLPVQYKSMTLHAYDSGLFFRATVDIAPELRQQLQRAMRQLGPEDEAQRAKCARGVPLWL